MTTLDKPSYSIVVNQEDKDIDYPLYQDEAQAKQWLAEVGWSGANSRLAEAYKKAAQAANTAQTAARARRSEVEDQLPKGWSALPLPSEPQYERYQWVAVIDENGNDVAWPLSTDEHIERAWREYEWREYGAEQRPDSKDDALYQQLKAKADELSAVAQAASEAWTAIGQSPAAQRRDAEQVAKQLAATQKREASRRKHLAQRIAI